MNCLPKRSLFPLSIIAGLTMLTACGDSAEKETASSAMTPPAELPMKDFFKNPEKASFRISPNGKYISYRAPWNSRMNIFVQSIGDSTATQVTHDTIRDIG